MEYHPSNKASSVTSITSNSSSSTDTSSIWDSIYIGRADSISTFEQDDILLPDSDEGFIFQSLSSSSNHDDNENKKNKSKRSSLLSEEQRRANHIASEKKRRNMIRGGFRELTELVPTLKNINNSKSVILFKSFEYIQHLEKRNSQLKKTLLQLQKKVNQKQARKMSYTSISIPNDNKNTYNTPALVMPVSVDGWFHSQSITPSFNIPAMDNDHFIIHGRESLLSSGKLNHLKQTK